MPVVYTNALSYLNVHQHISAEKMGYIDTVLRGSSLSKLFPIVPPNGFMKDVYYERGNLQTKISQKRMLNQSVDPKQTSPYKEKYELTGLYSLLTQIDKRLADHSPETFDQMMRDDATFLWMDIDYDIINGVVGDDGLGFNGLATRVPIGDAYDINAGATLNINASTANFKKFLRQFRQGVRKLQTGGQVIAICNEAVDLAVQSGRDELGANAVGTGTFDIMNQKVTMIDNVPLVVVRDDSAGNPILGMNENSESSTSIWLANIDTSIKDESKDIPTGVYLLSGDEVIKEDILKYTFTYDGVQEIEMGMRTPPGSVARLSRLLTTT